MNKKANVQLMENVFTVFILIFIGMIVLIFVGVNSFQNQRIAAEAEFEMESMRIAKSLQNLPEIQCTISDETIPYCIDFAKAKAFQIIVDGDLTNKELYFPILGRSTITVHNLETTNEVEVYTTPIGTSMQVFHLPVLIQEESGITSMGYIKVEVPR